ncbi:MAG TPA: 4a-hydroxytetrahydrobiopterin dehydratase [Gemmatimonadales bacterium]
MPRESALSADEIAAMLANLPAWKLESGALRRTYKTDGWRGSMLVANAIAFICEAADHHADVTVTWPAVHVTLSTHSAGGITPKDFEVAGLIESQIRWAPPAGSRLTGPAKPFVLGDA